LSDVERQTNKPTAGYAEIIIDGRNFSEVYYLFLDNFKSVMLTQNGIRLVGSEGELHHPDQKYRIKYSGKPGLWTMIDKFIA
jgi:hypothetical protein